MVSFLILPMDVSDPCLESLSGVSEPLSSLLTWEGRGTWNCESVCVSPVLYSPKNWRTASASPLTGVDMMAIERGAERLREISQIYGFMHGEDGLNPRRDS